MAVPYAPRDYYRPQGADRLIDLIMQRGQIAAQGAQNSGKIWGGAVNSLGEIAGQYMKDRQEKPLRDAKLAEIQSQIEFRKSQAQENTDQAEYRKFQMAGLKATQSKEEYNQYQHVMGQLGKGLYDASTEDPKGALPLFQQYHEVISQTAPKYLPIFEQFAADAQADPAKARKTAFDLWVNSPEVAKAKQTLDEKMAEPRVKAEDASLVTAGEDAFSYKPSKWEMPATSPAPPPSGPTLGDTATGGGRVLIPGTPKKPTQFELDKFENLKRHQKVMENKSSGIDDDSGGMSPAAIEMAAMVYRRGQGLPALGMGKSKDRTAILNRAPELTEEDMKRIEAGGLDVAAAKAQYRANSGSLATLQQSADAIAAFEETASKNIDIFLREAGKVVDTGSPLANKLARSVSGALLGSADQAGYNAARQVAINEVAKITSNPNLKGVLSDSARKEVEAFSPNEVTLAQAVRVARVVRQDMANRKQAYNEQIHQVMKRMGGGSQGGGASVLYRDAVNKSTGQKIKMKSVDGGTTWTPDQ